MFLLHFHLFSLGSFNYQLHSYQYLYCVPCSLVTTMVTLTWASLDMVTLDSLQVFKDQSLIQIWSATLFTLYHAASLIVLLNMLIAMMSNSYQRVEVGLTVVTRMYIPELQHSEISVACVQPPLPLKKIDKERL